jgi:hypothetical protein
MNDKKPVVLFGLLFLSFIIYFGTSSLSSNTVFAHHILDVIEVPRPMGM